MIKDLDKQNSYTAADNMPVKLIKDIDVIKEINETGRIIPAHVQFIPTNKCNLNCPFCSCAKDDRVTEISFPYVYRITNQLYKLGTKSVTITGGGEPLLHPEIEEIIKLFIVCGIKVGLVTNGLLLHKINPEVLNTITWCRISNGDFRTFTNAYSEHLSDVVKSCPNVDWAFSHVVSKKPNMAEIGKVVDFANEHNFTHVRLVADLFETEEVSLDNVKHYLNAAKIIDDKVIYQGRKEPTKGSDCRICYVKPLISADCKVYACCGVQYSLPDEQKHLPETLCLGSALDMYKIFESSIHPFKGGRKCVKCYYKNYNDLLEIMQQNVKHKEFL